MHRMYVLPTDCPTTVQSKQKGHFANCHSLLLKKFATTLLLSAAPPPSFIYISCYLSPSDEVVSHAKVGYLYPTRDCS